jgi:RNA polymerase sigma-70 factor (ECF subfamily)
MESRESDVAVLADSVGRPASFSLLYERHLQPVAVYLARRVGSDLSDDLTAEVFARAFRARATFRAEHETALPWLLGIASHLVADHRRAERRRLSVLQRLASGTPRTVHDDVAVLAPELVRELQRLSAADRDTLLLVVWGELSYEEAASALDIPVGTVRSRIARARRHLAAAIGETGERAVGLPPTTARGENDA